MSDDQGAVTTRPADLGERSTTRPADPGGPDNQTGGPWSKRPLRSCTGAGRRPSVEVSTGDPGRPCPPGAPGIPWEERKIRAALERRGPRDPPADRGPGRSQDASAEGGGAGVRLLEALGRPPPRPSSGSGRTSPVQRLACSRGPLRDLLYEALAELDPALVLTSENEGFSEVRLCPTTSRICLGVPLARDLAVPRSRFRRCCNPHLSCQKWQGEAPTRQNHRQSSHHG